MADYLAHIHGTEKDKVNCTFYYKVGACRHGNTCQRLHNKPTFSPTVLIRNLYQNPEHLTTGVKMPKEDLQAHLDAFFEDIFIELGVRYGELEQILVCDNIGEHLMGNLYVRFRNEEDAERASIELNERFYAGRPMVAELSPVTDFSEACCRQFTEGSCNHGGFCNFIHERSATRSLVRGLMASQRAMIQNRRKEAKAAQQPSEAEGGEKKE